MDFSEPDTVDLTALPLPPPDVPCVAIVANFGVGDIINATMSATQLRLLYPDCRVVFFTSAGFAFVLDNNPDIDCLITIDAEPHLLTSLTARLRRIRPWVRFLTPVAYLIPEFDNITPILPLVKAHGGVGVPIDPARRSVIRLRDEEIAAARAWWSALPEGPALLIETEFKSDQTPLDDSFIWAMGEALAPGGAFFVFSALNKPPFFDAFQARYPRSIWADVPFRWNIEFFEQASAFIGVSSGISVAISSEDRSLDKPWIEVCNGPIVSAGFYGQYRSLRSCYSKTRFIEAIGGLADRLYGLGGKPTFAARFVPEFDRYGFRHNCACCGESGAVGVHGRRIRECIACGFIFDAAPGSGTPGLCDERERARLLDAVLTVGLPAGSNVVLDFSRRDDGAPSNSNLRPMDPDQVSWVMPNGIAENTAAAILAPDVLACIPTPFEWLEQANFALAENGLLLLRVPHADSAAAQLQHGAWRPFNVPGARHFFKRWFLDGLAFQTGFAVERCWTQTLPERALSLAAGALTEPATVAETLAEVDRAVRGETMLYILRKRGPTQHRICRAGAC